MTHAIEGYVSSDWSPHSDAYAMAAPAYDARQPPAGGRAPGGRRGAENMLIADNLAIIPTSQAACGIAHSMAHACGAHFDVPHGVANAITCPGRSSSTQPAARTSPPLPRHQRGLRRRDRQFAATASGQLADHITGLVATLGLPTRLSQVGVTEAGIPDLVEGAMGDGCTVVNPREPTRGGVRGPLRQGALTVDAATRAARSSFGEDRDGDRRRSRAYAAWGNYIGGEWVHAADGATIDVYNPVHRGADGPVPSMSRERGPRRDRQGPGGPRRRRLGRDAARTSARGSCSRSSPS